MRNATFLFLWLLYYLLFWEEGTGLNLVLFGLLVSLSSKALQKQWKLREGEWPYILSFLATAYAVMAYNSALGIFAFCISNFSYQSFLWGPKLSVVEHFSHGFIRLFNFQKALLPEPAYGPPSSRRAFAVLRLSILPLVIFGLFFVLFRAGNPMFKEWTNDFTGLFTQLFEDFSWGLFWFMFFGFFILRSVFLRNKSWPLSFQAGDFIRRKPGSKKQKSFSSLALKREYRMALLVFFSLNILLLIVNVIDIRWYWFGFDMPAHFSLKEFLHEGVAYLIASLILAAAVVFYFFRCNLNFYPGNKGLKVLAQIWLIQNAVLSISVLLRTKYYIDFHGLAYGRILVVSILSIVLVGLFLLNRKLREARNYSYVFRHVSLYSLLLIAGLSLWDMDSSIVRHNLSHGRINEIDVDNYLRLNSRVLPIIYANLDRIEEQINAHQANDVRWIKYRDIEDFSGALEARKEVFLRGETKQSFWSWNWADAKSKKSLASL